MYFKEDIQKQWKLTGIHPNDLDENGNIKPAKPLPKMPSILDGDWTLVSFVLFVTLCITLTLIF